MPRQPKLRIDDYHIWRERLQSVGGNVAACAKLHGIRTITLQKFLYRGLRRIRARPSYSPAIPRSVTAEEAREHEVDWSQAPIAEYYGMPWVQNFGRKLRWNDFEPRPSREQSRRKWLTQDATCDTLAEGPNPLMTSRPGRVFQDAAPGPVSVRR